jgi:squalene cyclase
VKSKKGGWSVSWPTVKKHSNRDEKTPYMLTEGWVLKFENKKHQQRRTPMKNVLGRNLFLGS